MFSMLKLVGGTSFGILIGGIGIYIASIYVMTRQEGGSPILVGIGAVLVAGGIYSIIKGVLSFKTEKALASDTSLELEVPQVNGEGGAIVKKNNELLKDWNKTTDTRDKLKLLGAANNAEKGK